MVVIDWLQTCEFVRDHSEQFILYFLCGGLIGIGIILISIILLLYIEKRLKMTTKENDVEYEQAPPYLPVYRYDGRNHSGFYHV